MGSRPKVIRLSESSPPSDLDLEEEPPEKNQEKKPDRSSLIGGVMEKGFSGSHSKKVSIPEPRVTPFPVARHRSEGPYWAPSRMAVNSTRGDNAEEEAGRALAGFAEPLSRSKGRTSPVASQWRSNLRSSSNESSNGVSVDTRSTDSPGSTTSEAEARRDSRALERRLAQDELAQLDSAKTSESGCGFDKSKADIISMSHIDSADMYGRSPGKAQTENFVDTTYGQSARELIDGTDASRQEPVFDRKTIDHVAVGKAEESRVPGNGSEGDSRSVRGVSNMGSLEMVDQEIDHENRKAVLSMSDAEVAEAQTELSERLRPELLDMLRRRGLEKERKRSTETTGAAGSRLSQDFGMGTKEETSGDSRSSAEYSFKKEVSTVSANGTGSQYLTDQPSLLQAEPLKLESRGQSVGELPPSGELSNQGIQTKADSPELWTLRVEAVRSMRFDLDGSVLFSESAKEESEGTAVQNQENALSVVERDMLRTEGNPAGSGYTLKEALNLVRSTVPGQRAVALRLIASVLDKALQGLQVQQLKPDSFADLEGIVDWQAVWAYALGPEAELVLTLRLALDDGHSTVVSACARALQALLSYSANESFFDSLEGLSPGEKVVYTAPIFRRKTKHDEGFIGSGRWKYNVKRSEMFPFSGTSAQEQVEEEGTDTVGDDGHIANKDVAAGLVRMGLLPRIRYILEVDQLIVADDALLCVLISLARHSPSAAAAVMTCPRLIDTILHRFVFKHGVESEESWSCQLKAVRLLKVLSQASRSNCMQFEKYGVLEALLRPLSQKPSQELGGRESLRGFYSTTIETIRFWTVCLSYRIGLSFFTDCYPTLCIWLLPLSGEEMLRECSGTSFTLAMEAYSLLGNIARTLPTLHDNLSPTAALAVQLGGTRWSWSVAMTMLNTALKWLSPDRIFTVHLLLKQFLQGQGEQVHNGIALRTRTRKVLGLLGSVLHFLATVCEKIVSDKELEPGLTDCSNFSLPWLPTFVPHLGLAIASSGLLNVARDELQSDPPNGELGKTHSLLDFMCFCLSKRDNDSMLVALNCQCALVRVSSIVDKLIYINKPKGVSGPADQPMAHALLDQGLIVSAGDALRRWIAVIGTTAASRSSLIDMSSRGGPAPGMGVGWGSLRGGVFSKDVLVAQASARLNLELVSALSVNPSLTFSEDEASVSGVPGREKWEGTLFDPVWRINTGLALAALASPPNVELVRRGCSMTIFHPHSLSLIIEKFYSRVVSWGSEDPGGSYAGYCQGDNIFESAHLSKILIQHLETFWLAAKSKKAQDSEESRTRRGKPNGSLDSKLPTVHEEGTEDGDITPQRLIDEFVGQRLPLPSHWFLSPLAVDIARAATTDSVPKTEELEEVVTAGLAFFLGLELLKADICSLGPVIPLVRKIHSVSCVFVTGGDVFLRPLARHLIGALQDVIGRQLEEEPIFEQSEDEKILETGNGEEQEEARLHGDQSGSAVETVVQVPSGETGKVQRLDFEGLIDPSYVTYAEAIAEHFVASSYGDLVFGRQVALHLWTACPQNIRLATWRVLADARVLELLPPLSQCCGQPSRYLNPVETDQKMLDAYVSAWKSGALDKAATRNSLPIRLALHHLGAYIFDEKDGKDGEELLLQRKYARTLVRSTLRRSDRQAMLIRLLVGSAAHQSSRDVKEQGKRRLAFLAEACEGDGTLLAEIQRVSGML